jgi:hypothetical protein
MIKSRRDEMGRVCSMHGKKMNEYRILVGKSGRKRPLGLPRRDLEYNI